MSDTENKRRLITRWELFFLILAILIILYAILQKFGINVVEVTEESEIIQRPHQ
jgi:hypothetical protein